MTISARELSPGSKWYVVTALLNHWTLREGDLVQVVKCPYETCNYLYRGDGTLHECQGSLDLDVTLEEVKENLTNDTEVSL